MNGFTAEEFEPDAAEHHQRRQRHHGEGTAATAAPVTLDTREHRRQHRRGNSRHSWPALGAAAYHGLAGEVVNTLLPQTEADPVALLLQYLAYFGNAVGRGPHYQVENDKHFANLFAAAGG